MKRHFDLDPSGSCPTAIALGINTDFGIQPQPVHHDFGPGGAVLDIGSARVTAMLLNHSEVGNDGPGNYNEVACHTDGEFAESGGPGFKMAGIDGMALDLMFEEDHDGDPATWKVVHMDGGVLMSIIGDTVVCDIDGVALTSTWSEERPVHAEEAPAIRGASIAKEAAGASMTEPEAAGSHHDWAGRQTHWPVLGRMANGTMIVDNTDSHTRCRTRSRQDEDNPSSRSACHMFRIPRLPAIAGIIAATVAEFPSLFGADSRQCAAA